METLIAPLAFLLQLALQALYSIFDNYGLAIIYLSVLISTLLLPIQILTDKIQNKDRLETQIMQWELQPIRLITRAQEKFYYTSYIYNKYQYHPIKSLRNIISLLIQLPFFLAAYFMLGHYEAFQSQHFLFIKDLSVPDQLLGGHNIFPILMTLVNLVSAACYLAAYPKLNRRTIIPQLILPLIFLVILYNKNSALLLYWTCNNIFSLIKNIIQNYSHIKTKLKIKRTQVFSLDSIKNILLRPFSFFTKNEFIIIYSGLIIYLILVYFLYHQEESPSIIDNAPKIAVVIFDLLILCCIYRLRSSLILLFKRNILSISIVQKAVLTLAIFTGLYIVSFHLLRIAKIQLSDLIYNFFTILFLQLFFIFLLFLLCGYRSFCTVNKQGFKLKLSELLILALLPATIILNLIHSNLDYFTIKNSIIFFVASVSILFILLLLMQKILLRFTISPYILIVINIIITNYILIPSLLPYFKLNNNNSIYLQIFSYLFLSAFTLFLFQKNKRFLYLLISGVFVFYFAIYVKDLLFHQDYFAKVSGISRDERSEESIFYKGKQPEIAPEGKDLVKAIAEKIDKKPNIYLLIYDGYPSQHMMKYYGLDNQSQLKFLEDENFKIYPDAYSLGRNSIRSLSLTLQFYRYGDFRQRTNALGRNRVAGNNISNYLLREQNYKTYNLLLNSYMFLGNEPTTTYTVPKPSPSHNDILYGLLYGEYKFARFPVINSDGLSDYLLYDKFKDIKLGILKNQKLSPKFIYSHIGPSHSQNSGVCLPDETEQFNDRLQAANLDMQQDVQAITTTDKNSVIIIAGDHGPALTKDCLFLHDYPENQITAQDIADRIGIFLAIKWPVDYLPNYQIETLQDAMPAVFSYMTGENIATKYNLDIEKKSYLFSKLFVEDGIIQYGKDKGKALYHWVKD